MLVVKYCTGGALKSSIPTWWFFSNDRSSRDAGISWSSFVDCFHSELILLTFLEIRDGTLVLLDWEWRGRCPVAILRLHFDLITFYLTTAGVCRLCPGQSDRVRSHAVNVRSSWSSSGNYTYIKIVCKSGQYLKYNMKLETRHRECKLLPKLKNYVT